MNTTIEQLARTVAEQRRTSYADARDAVTAYVDQITDDPNLWHEDSATITDAGVRVIQDQIAASIEQGYWQVRRYTVRGDGHAAYGVWDGYLVRFEQIGLTEGDAEAIADELNGSAA